MEILFKSPKQVEIANMLWKCETREQALEVIKTHGVEAEIVYNMIITCAIDNETANDESFPEVLEILDNLK